jgi:hypothetical protein
VFIAFSDAFGGLGSLRRGAIARAESLGFASHPACQIIGRAFAGIKPCG